MLAASKIAIRTYSWLTVIALVGLLTCHTKANVPWVHERNESTPSRPGDISLEGIESALENVKQQRLMCGPIALAISLQLRGQSCSLTDVVAKCELSAQGVAFSKLGQVANSIERGATTIILDGKDVGTLNLPAIVVVDGNHAVVLAKNDPSRRVVTVVDGSRQRIDELPTDWFLGRWTGHAIVFPRQYGTVEVVAVVLASTVSTIIAGAFFGRMSSIFGVNGRRSVLTPGEHGGHNDHR